MFDITGLVILTLVVLPLIYDLYAYRKSKGEASISNWIRVMSRDWPIIPFLVGVLIGHFFFYK